MTGDQTPHAPAESHAERPEAAADTPERGEAAEGLTGLVGLDPNLTGGLDPAEYIARQNCDHGEELDRLRARLDAIRALCDMCEQGEPSAVFSQGGPVWGVWTEDVRKAMDGGE